MHPPPRRLLPVSAMTESFRFEVATCVDPQAVSRLINFFAQRDLIPRQVHVRLAEDQIAALIEQDGLYAHRAKLIAEKMRASVLVRSVAFTSPMSNPGCA